MAVTAKVTFDPGLETKIDEVKSKLLEELALQIKGQAQINIVENDQVDTGFMLNSIYELTPEGSGYGQAQGEANAKNPDADMSPEARVGQDQAAVVAGASYAIYQENRRSFLYKAGEQVAKQSGATIERVGNEVLND